jgi:DNA repair protein RadC
VVALLAPFRAGFAERYADRLIREFGSLAATLAAPRPALARVVPSRAAEHLTTIREAMLHALRSEIETRPILSNWQAVMDYLNACMAHDLIEQVRVLFLDTRNHLIKDEVMWRGSIDEAPIYVREVMRRSLEVGAGAIIVAHNHPSGSHTPSRADIDVTRNLAEAGKRLGVHVHDHLIISRDGWSSMREQRLI